MAADALGPRREGDVVGVEVFRAPHEVHLVPGVDAELGRREHVVDHGHSFHDDLVVALGGLAVGAPLFSTPSSSEPDALTIEDGVVRRERPYLRVIQGGQASS